MEKRLIRIGDTRISEVCKHEIKEILDSNALSEGMWVSRLEKKFAEIMEVPYCILLNSGTSALIASLLACRYLDEKQFNRKTESELPYVITNALSFISDPNAIRIAGFEPIFVDTDLDTFGMDYDKLKDIGDRYKNQVFAYLPVHLMGYATPQTRNYSGIGYSDAFIIEDACEALGTKVDGQYVGSLGDVGCVSFYICHHIAAGEMGAIVTRNEEIYKLIQKIKAHGRICNCQYGVDRAKSCPHYIDAYQYGFSKEDDIDTRYFHDLVGYNFKTTEINACLAYDYINTIDDIRFFRQINFQSIRNWLKEFEEFFILPKVNLDTSYFGFPIIIKELAPFSRKEIRTFLESNGIETRPIFMSFNKFPQFKNCITTDLTNADMVSKYGFYIGCHQYLSKEDIEYIYLIFKQFHGKHKN